jgi:hypothetical protein
MEADRPDVGRHHELVPSREYPVPGKNAPASLGTRAANWTFTHSLGDTLLLSKSTIQGVPHYQEHRKSFAHGPETYREKDRG